MAACAGGAAVATTTTTANINININTNGNSNGNGNAHIRSQMSRSLDRILDEAAASGHLRLSGRKLKDFPNTGKYHLADTVLADLSKNRFGEIPDEVTAFYFLERLLLYHNAIRSVPDTVGMLQSLSYLDLSHNQLSEVPRELCQLPLQVLLLSNNRLTSLPKEIGKMSILAELDASNNQISQLPMTIGDIPNLKALNLRNNQLGLLPLQITYLQLEILDISCNCISSLPLELRHMTSLVNFKLEHNPLVSPPATVCVRGRIHIFKYLENQANKDGFQKRGDDTRRSAKQSNLNNLSHNITHTQSPSSFVVDGLRHKVRYNVDSGYSTSDGGEKRWSSDGLVVEENATMPIILGSQSSGRSTPSTPSTISPGPAHLSRAHSLSAETPPTTPTLGSRISPDGNNMSNGDDKTKSISHQQTYRQYKEALRQQRQQDVYRPRNEQTSPPSTTPTPTNNHSYSTPHSPVANGYHHRSVVSSNPSLPSAVAQNSPTNTLSSNHSTPKKFLTPSNILYQPGTYSENSNQINNTLHKNDDASMNRKPVQKVVPSRSTNKPFTPTAIPVSNSNNSLSPILSNGNLNSENTTRLSENRNYDGSYMKPVSPIKGSSSFMTHNNVPSSKSNSLGRNYKTSPTDTNPTDQNGSPKLLTTTVGFVNNSTPGLGNNTSRINWNKDSPPDKLSFTMKREFDRAKEESELIQQLRSIIENRLKMSLPRDIAPALSDGVVLCHLANHVCPRSVASVHVPSAAQPKLTMARCRRNVDNFLEACRRIGVEEKLMCCAADVLEGKGVVQVAITVTELHRKHKIAMSKAGNGVERRIVHPPLL
ncbi:leucine-rich-repeats and calponin homology domain protein isoform X2 [Arctopsyche grandis]|uniref:leucine-rich-repeats and calponin homology domain protein isoform X2 n=1 Tax=Arctopsyche grandis TaxID=121162 RepID=UPI00406D9455